MIARMRPKLAKIPGISVFMYASQDLRAGGRQSDSQYQFTLWSADIDELNKWVPRAVDRVKQVPGMVDVTTDRDAAACKSSRHRSSRGGAARRACSGH